MREKMRRKLLIQLLLFLLFACTDIYLIRGIKLVYIFIPILFLQLILRKLKIRKNDRLLLLWFVSYFLSIEHIVSIKDFIVVLVGQIALFVVYFYITSINDINLLNSIEWYLNKTLYLMVFVGLVQISLYYLFGIDWGISHVNHGVGLPRMSGLNREPDWYGLLCVISAIFALVNIISCDYVHNKALEYTAFIVSCVMLLASLTRAAWFGFVVGILLIIVLFRKKLSKNAKKRFAKLMFYSIIFFLLSLFVVSVICPEIWEKLLLRITISTWMTADGGATNSRLGSVKILIHYIKMHPLTGNGVGGMGYLSLNESVKSSLGIYSSVNTGRGNTNIILTNLFDVGVIGTLFLLSYFCCLLHELFKSYKDTKDVIYLKLYVVIIALLADFQFNNGLRITYVWILLGLANSYIRLNSMKNEII